MRVVLQPSPLPYLYAIQQLPLLEHAAVMPLIETMQHAGFRVSDSLKTTIQRLVAE